MGWVLLAELPDPRATLFDTVFADKRSRRAQLMHQTFFDDSDQCARVPACSLLAHVWQRPAYFSEIKRRSSGNFVFRLLRSLIVIIAVELAAAGLRLTCSLTKRLVNRTRNVRESHAADWTVEILREKA